MRHSLTPVRPADRLTADQTVLRGREVPLACAASIHGKPKAPDSGIDSRSECMAKCTSNSSLQINERDDGAERRTKDAR